MADHRGVPRRHRREPGEGAGLSQALAGLWARLTGAEGDPALGAVSVSGVALSGPAGDGGPDPVLPTVFRVGEAATATVATATLAAAVFGAERTRGPGTAPPPVAVDVRHAVAACRSERYLRVDGRIASFWEPLSGDYRAADGWVRLHCNFAHHAEAVCRALGLPADADRAAVERAVAGRAATDVERRVLDAGGAAGALRSASEWAGEPQARAVEAAGPLAVRAIDGAPDAPARTVRSGSRDGRAARPLAGVRVLDLTRVIAGPVAGRVLTSWGADVLAVRAPHLPTVAWTDVDTGFGKRARVLDLRDRSDHAVFLDLVRRADIVVHSYRPGALERLGLSPAELAAVRPGLGHVAVSAYGEGGPWAGRRGFDSVVQLVTGLAHTARAAAGGADDDPPVPLPGQFLDHGAGWLAAAAAIETLRRARRDGGAWQAHVTLAGVAGWLTGLGTTDAAEAPAEPSREEAADLLATMRAVTGERIEYVRPPGTIAGLSPSWESPTPFGIPALP